MSVKAELDGGELASSSFWVPSPLMQGNPAPSITRSSICASTGSKALRPGDWRRAAAAETGGEPVQGPSQDVRFTETPNIDDVHSPASVNFDNGTGPRMASPLLPRALAANSGLSARATSPPAGRPCASRMPGSPSSVVSLSTGEASFRLDLPELEFQDASPSELSPVRPRRGLPVESELSTPGSDGYASPSVLFVIPPSSLMRSSVHNPLYVDRPTPSEADNVAKALVLSPCSDRSPASRPTRRTFESGWSSPTSSAEQSISLNPSQQDDRLSPLPHLEATSSPVASSMRQRVPLLQPTEDTPRRIIKAMSMSQDAVFGADYAAWAASPRHAAGLQLQAHSSLRGTSLAGEPSAATPCSAALSGRLVKAPVPDAADLEASGPSSAKAAQQPGSARAASVVNNRLSVDLDDTVVTGRTLDQTPRKAARAASQSGIACSKGTPEKQQLNTKLTQQSTARPEAKQLEPQAARRGSALRTFGSWILLSLVVVMVGSRINSIERLVPSAMPTAWLKTGPVCFRELYPGAFGALPPTRSARLSMPSTEASLAGVECEVTGFIAHADFSRDAVHGPALAEPLGMGPQDSADVDINSFTPYTPPGVGDGVALGYPLAASDVPPGAADVDALEQLTVVSDTLSGAADVDALGQLPIADDGVSHLVDSDVNAGHIAVTVETGVEPVVQDSPDQPHEQAIMVLYDSIIEEQRDAMDNGQATTVLDDSTIEEQHDATDNGPAIEEPSEQEPELLISSDDFAPEQDAPDAELPSPCSNTAAEELVQEVASLPEACGFEVEGPAVDLDLRAGSGDLAVENDAIDVDLALGADPAVLAPELLPAAAAIPDSMDVENYPLNDYSNLPWFFAKRVYGWNLLELLLGVMAAVLAGVLLALTGEYLNAHMQRRQRLAKSNDRGASANQQELPPPSPATRILRLRRLPGAMTGNDQVAPDAVPVQATYNDGAQREQGPGSLIWTGNKLVYFEG